MSKWYRLMDNGLRCFRAPCFSWDAIDLETRLITKISDVEISDSIGVNASAISNSGLKVSGIIKERRNRLTNETHVVLVIDAVEPRVNQ